MKDDLRTKGAMLFRCSGKCGWDVFVDCVDPRLPDGPIFCTECRTPSAAGMNLSQGFVGPEARKGLDVLKGKLS